MIPEFVPEAGVCIPFSELEMSPERGKKSPKIPQPERGKAGAYMERSWLEWRPKATSM